MGDVGNIFGDVFGVVTDIVGGVVDIVTSIIGEVSRIVFTPEFLLIAAICIGAVYAAPAVSAAYASAASTQLAAYSVSMSTADAMIVGTSAFTSAVSAGLTAFTTAIHLKTVMEVHTVAMLVSSDYREMMTGVYREIAAVSSALGFYPQFLALAIRNSRQLVLSSSNLMGRKYDLAQVEWLTTFNSYLTEFNRHAKEYKKNPENLFYDLEQFVEKPALDAGGDTMQTAFVILSDLTKAVAADVKDMKKTRDDLDRLVHDLPENIRSQIEPYTKPIIKRFDDFRTKTYDPAAKKFNSMLDKFGERYAKTEDDLDSVVGRLAKPGDYLLEIDSMSPDEKVRQEAVLAEITSRRHREQTTAYIAHAKDILVVVEEKSRALYPSAPPSTLLRLEPTEPTKLPEERITRLKSWFVGDY